MNPWLINLHVNHDGMQSDFLCGIVSWCFLIAAPPISISAVEVSSRRVAIRPIVPDQRGSVNAPYSGDGPLQASLISFAYIPKGGGCYSPSPGYVKKPRC